MVRKKEIKKTKEIEDTKIVKPKRTIRVPKFWKSTLFWVFLLFLQTGVLYGITYWGYHSNRTPYWFDNFVQEKGIWKIYGVKEYKLGLNTEHLVHPKSDIVLKDVYRVIYQGIFYENVDGKIKMIAMDKDIFEMKIEDGVKIYLCKNFKNGAFSNCVEKNEMQDLIVGSLTTIVSDYSFKDDQYTISIYQYRNE